MKKPTSLAILLWLSYASLAAEAGAGFADGVGTLSLDAKLDARGDLPGRAFTYG